MWVIHQWDLTALITATRRANYLEIEFGSLTVLRGTKYNVKGTFLQVPAEGGTEVSHSDSSLMLAEQNKLISHQNVAVLHSRELHC